MMKRVNPDRIIKDCTDVIDHIVRAPVPSLLPERDKAKYYRGRARYYKGEVESERGDFLTALSDFLTVAQNHRTTARDMRAIAWHFCGLCCKKLGEDERSECYFDKARRKGFAEDPHPFYLEPIVQEVEDIKNRVRQALGFTEDSE